MDTTWSADEIFNDKLANLGNEAKRRLIELLAASLTFSDSKQDDDRLFEEICGSWADDGLTAEEEIKELQTARRQDTTRNIINLMKQYLLDTNICIYFLKNQYGVAEHIKAVGNKNCFISDITLAELYFGASNSGQKEHKIKGVKAIEKYFTVIPIQKALECYGDCKAVLKKQGKLIDDFDLLIGATAMTCNLIMVTENVKHLARIPNINIENWIKK